MRLCRGQATFARRRMQVCFCLGFKPNEGTLLTRPGVVADVGGYEMRSGKTNTNMVMMQSTLPTSVTCCLDSLLWRRVPWRSTSCNVSAAQTRPDSQRRASHQSQAFSIAQQTREQQGDSVVAVGPYCLWPQAQTATASGWHSEVRPPHRSSALHHCKMLRASVMKPAVLCLSSPIQCV